MATQPDENAPHSLNSLPAEIRLQIWNLALPPPRPFVVLVFGARGLRMRLLSREGLRMPLAHVCYESRQVVKQAGYKLAFQDEALDGDVGVWYHPDRDTLERTIWGPGEALFAETRF